MMHETIYSAESQLVNWRQLLVNAGQDIRNAGPLGRRLFVHHLKAEHRRSLLGYLWLLLPPIATTLLWTYLNQANIVDVGQTTMAYPLYVLTGTLLWQLFVDALNAPLKQLQQSRSTLKNINFPAEALILAGGASVLFQFVIRLFLLIIVMFGFSVTPQATFFAALVGVIGLLMLGLALGIWLAIPGLLYQDVARGLTIVTSLWFFITPIVYPVPTDGGLAQIARLNPVTPLLTTTRAWLLNERVVEPIQFWNMLLAACAMLLSGWFMSRLARPHLIARMP